MRLIPILLLLAALMAPVVAAMPGLGLSQTVEGFSETPELMLDRLKAESDLIERAIDQGISGRGQVEDYRSALEDHRSSIPGVIAAAEAEIAPLRDQLDALGERPAEDDPETDEIAAERERLSDEIAEREALVKRYKQADARAVALQAQLAEIRRALVTRRLLTRSSSILEQGAVVKGIASIRDVAGAITRETRENAAQSRLDTPFFVRVFLPLTLIGFALLLVIRVQRRLMDRMAMRGAGEMPVRAVVGILVTLIRLFTPLIALALAAFAIWNSGFLGPKGEVLLAGIMRALGAVIIAYALGGAFYAPRLPELRLSVLSDEKAIAAQRWLMALAAVIGLDVLLVVQADQLGLSFEGLDLFNTALLVVGGVALWGYSTYLDCGPRKPSEVEPQLGDDDDDPVPVTQEITLAPLLTAIVRTVLRIAAIAAPALAMIGFFAASRMAFYPTVLSGAVIAVGVLIVARVRDIVARVTQPDDEAKTDAEVGSGRLRLIPIMVGFLLICAATPILALIWGADSADMENAWRAVSDGFTIGETTISPLDFFSFLFVFSIGYLLTRLIQGILGRSVLPFTGLDVGGRALVRAGVFYAGIMFSALIAISTTGLDLSNLAIVAGALSVGIGFGLQNVVNNFVSGIILLIERPIKDGDWVEINGVHGTVQKVNVRSTEILTFDRSTMFVPNADLISNTVTNWTHGSSQGRIIVKVGVAYGNDTNRISEVLLEIAKAHSMLLRRPEPFILFRGFGADSLDFEIRGVLRDVIWIYRVTSDINHEIARRFAEEGIEIPFAQRDLRIRNAKELGDAIAGATGKTRDQATDTALAGARDETDPDKDQPARDSGD